MRLASPVTVAALVQLRQRSYKGTATMLPKGATGLPHPLLKLAYGVDDGHRSVYANVLGADGKAPMVESRC